MSNKFKTAFDNLILFTLDKYPVITVCLVFAALLALVAYDIQSDEKQKKFQPIKQCKINAVIPEEFIQVTTVNPDNGRINVTFTFDPGLLCYACDTGDTFCR